MFCPSCGQQRISEATSFCSRCGYLLTGTAELMTTGGMPLQIAAAKGLSPRSRGIRQGLFMFLLTFMLAPIVGLISQFGLGIEPWPVGVVVALLGVGGVLRIIYALMFEPKDPVVPVTNNREVGYTSVSTAALPPQRDMPASTYAAPTSAWRESEIQTHGSVTESTTRLLEKDDE